MSLRADNTLALPGGSALTHIFSETILLSVSSISGARMNGATYRGEKIVFLSS